MKQRSNSSILFLFISLCWLTSCQPDQSSADDELIDLLSTKSDGKGLSFFMLPDGKDLSAFPQDPKNPITSGKIELGRALFHETGLGRNPMNNKLLMNFSCSSCHQFKAGFQAGIAQGIGEGGEGFGLNGENRHPINGLDPKIIDVQPIRSPSILNAAYQTNQLWNGQFGATHLNKGTEASWTVGSPKEKNFLGFEGVETQAIAGQDVHRLKVDQQFLTNFPMYPLLFALAYPEKALSDRMTQVNAGLAIAAYERTVVSNKAPFQRWLQGDYGAMSKEQKDGAILFFGKAGCVQCHTGPALNKMDFYALGMNDLLNGSYGVINSDATKPEHKGRGGFTNRQEDMFKFKVPQLYNLKGVKFLGHGAQFSSVQEVVEYKNKGVPSNSSVPLGQLAAEFKPLGLSAKEISRLTAFLEDGLFDPLLERYTPTGLPTGLCFPNNDLASRADNGCN